MESRKAARSKAVASPPSPHVILEKNNLQTAQGWTKSNIELVASYVHPKTNN